MANQMKPIQEAGLGQLIRMGLNAAKSKAGAVGDAAKEIGSGLSTGTTKGALLSGPISDFKAGAGYLSRAKELANMGETERALQNVGKGIRNIGLGTGKVAVPTSVAGIAGYENRDAIKAALSSDEEAIAQAAQEDPSILDRIKNSASDAYQSLDDATGGHANWALGGLGAAALASGAGALALRKKLRGTK